MRQAIIRKNPVETGKLTVNEIFYSLQGESSHAGRPCAFVRLTRCNLRCRYCDTAYAFTEGREMTVPEILEQLNGYPTNLVEVTGGEPLLQHAVHALVKELLDSGKQVLIETGGSIDITPVDQRAVLVYDIKCPESGMSGHNLWGNLERLRSHDEIKFVISDRADYEWAREVVRFHCLADRHLVLFSPVWKTMDAEKLAGWILQDGLHVRLQVQLHKLLWGERRGV